MILRSIFNNHASWPFFIISALILVIIVQTLGFTWTLSMLKESLVKPPTISGPAIDPNLPSGENEIYSLDNTTNPQASTSALNNQTSIFDTSVLDLIEPTEGRSCTIVVTDNPDVAVEVNLLAFEDTFLFTVKSTDVDDTNSVSAPVEPGTATLSAETAVINPTSRVSTANLGNNQYLLRSAGNVYVWSEANNKGSRFSYYPFKGGQVIPGIDILAQENLALKALILLTSTEPQSACKPWQMESNVFDLPKTVGFEVLTN